MDVREISAEEAKAMQKCLIDAAAYLAYVAQTAEDSHEKHLTAWLARAFYTMAGDPERSISCMHVLWHVVPRLSAHLEKAMAIMTDAHNYAQGKPETEGMH